MEIIKSNPLWVSELQVINALDMKRVFYLELDCEVFLRLTTSGEEHYQQIFDEAQSIGTYNQALDEGRILTLPYLVLSGGNGKYVCKSHEGRHRASASITEAKKKGSSESPKMIVMLKFDFFAYEGINETENFVISGEHNNYLKSLFEKEFKKEDLKLITNIFDKEFDI